MVGLKDHLTDDEPLTDEEILLIFNMSFIRYGELNNFVY